jgi:hypothetical protein
LVLEDVEYSTMWIGDVNNYIAQATSGKLKLKGRFWYPAKFPDDITNASPPAWHKDLSNIVSTMAAVEHMTKGTPIERFIYDHADPFDFMIRAKCDRVVATVDWRQADAANHSLLRRAPGRTAAQGVAAGGCCGRVQAPVGISDHEYYSIKQTLAPGVHDPRIHTKNKSTYITREKGFRRGSWWRIAASRRRSTGTISITIIIFAKRKSWW